MTADVPAPSDRDIIRAHETRRRADSYGPRRRAVAALRRALHRPVLARRRHVLPGQGWMARVVNPSGGHWLVPVVGWLVDHDGRATVIVSDSWGGAARYDDAVAHGAQVQVVGVFHADEHREGPRPPEVA
jgi:hypothetical protein